MAQLKPKPTKISKETTPQNYYSLNDLQKEPQTQESEKIWSIVAKGLTKVFKGMRNNELKG